MEVPLSGTAALAQELSKLHFLDGHNDGRAPSVDLLFPRSMKLSTIFSMTKASPKYKKIQQEAQTLCAELQVSVSYCKSSTRSLTLLADSTYRTLLNVHRSTQLVL